LSRKVEQLASELSNVDWAWDVMSWQKKADDFGLKEKEILGNRRAYASPMGDIWYAYLDEGLLRVEVNYDIFEDSSSLSDLDYEDKVDEYFEKFEDDVASVEKILGEPTFCDGSAVKGFPKDQEADWLALWPIRNCRLMLQQKHGARKLPFRLCFVVAPPV
jgi:hypothetical protein